MIDVEVELQRAALAQQVQAVAMAEFISAMRRGEWKEAEGPRLAAISALESQYDHLAAAYRATFRGGSSR